MEAKDIMNHECICVGYDFEPFYSPWDREHQKLNHCYECDAYNDGKKAQAEISFKAGIREVVKWIKEHTNMPIQSDFVVFASKNDKGELVIGNHIEVKQWLAKIKEWGINP